jgi:ABC-type transport system involved in multi-copper enzyme maturation permease subunit
MNGHLILREWKEKFEIPLLSLVLLIMLIGLISTFPQRGDVLVLLTGSIVLVFLPFLGILIGANAFNTEIKDGAWAYLFSRPVKKSSVWISKFIALLGYLAATLLAYYVVLSMFPGIRDRLNEFGFEQDPLGWISPWTLCLILSFSLFIIAFSLSFLTDNQFHVIFFSLFVFAGLAILLFTILITVAGIKPRFVFLVPIAWGLALAGVVGASLAAFCRSDFSQPRRKVLGFLKWSALFLAPAFICILAAAWIGEWLSPLEYMNVMPEGRFVFIQTNRGDYRYDADRDELKRLGGASWDWGFSAGGGKIVMLKSFPKGTGQEPRLWIMDEDGSNQKPLISAQDWNGSLFRGQYVECCSLSRDGTRVVFITRPVKSGTQSRLWSVSSDGTGLRDYKVDIPNAQLWFLNGWTGDNRHVLLIFSEILTEYVKRAPTRWLVKFSLENGAWQMFAENAMMTYALGLSPAGDKLGAAFRSPQPTLSVPSKPHGYVYTRPDTLAVFDLETLTRTDILKGWPFNDARWDPTGARIAFLTEAGKRLSVYSLAENRVSVEREIGTEFKDSNEDSLMRGIDWADGGRKIAIIGRLDKQYVLRIFDDKLAGEKSYRIPSSETFMFIPHPHGLGAKVLVQDYQSSRLLVFDLATEKWRKLF